MMRGDESMTDSRLRETAEELWESIPDFDDPFAEVGIEMILSVLEAETRRAREEAYAKGVMDSAEIAMGHDQPEGSNVMWKQCGGRIAQDILSLLTPKESEKEIK